MKKKIIALIPNKLDAKYLAILSLNKIDFF